MENWRDCQIITYGDDSTIEHIEGDVRFNDSEIVVTYKEGIQFIEYHGSNDGENHFNLGVWAKGWLRYPTLG